jgi:hypothetical protein|tara:strand:- start:599 stop:721 length:123 start_codon:yes stop_codon:yes gene_type:complete
MDSNADAVVETRSFSAEEQRGAYGAKPSMPFSRLTSSTQF